MSMHKIITTALKHYGGTNNIGGNALFHKQQLKMRDSTHNCYMYMTLDSSIHIYSKLQCSLRTLEQEN